MSRTKTTVSAKPQCNDTAVSEPLVRKFSKQDLAEAGCYDYRQARALLDSYYAMQKLRMGTGNRSWAIDAQRDTAGSWVEEQDPGGNITEVPLVQKLKANLLILEGNVERALGTWVRGQTLGCWALSQAGVGPVLAAGFLAYIDFYHCCCPSYRGIKDKPKHKCPGLTTYGAILRFAGQVDPREIAWEKGMKRPYNARLKNLCWKLGKSFVCIGDKPGHFYNRIYRQRKLYEIKQDKKGANQERAQWFLDQARRKHWQISELQRTTWESGHLQPAGLDLRAMRHTVKIFLSHFHQVGREILFGEVVVPYPMVHLGHSKYIPPPNWPMEE